jgi:hypothetical protein
MKNPNLYLPGFYFPSLPRRPRATRQKTHDQLTEVRRKPISQLAQRFTDFIPDQIQPDRSI